MNDQDDAQQQTNWDKDGEDFDDDTNLESDGTTDAETALRLAWFEIHAPWFEEPTYTGWTKVKGEIFVYNADDRDLWDLINDEEESEHLARWLRFVMDHPVLSVDYLQQHRPRKLTLLFDELQDANLDKQQDFVVDYVVDDDNAATLPTIRPAVKSRFSESVYLDQDNRLYRGTNANLFVVEAEGMQ